MYLSWAPPSLDSLTYGNCSAIAAWSSEVVNDTLAWDFSGVTFQSAYYYLKSTLAPALSANLSRSDLILWYLLDQDDATLDGPLNQWMLKGRESCVGKSVADKAEFCTTKGVAGSSETTGPGAFASYCIEAGLATLYLLVILLDRLQPHSSWPIPSGWEKSPKKIHSFLSRARPQIINAFRESLPDFLDAALFFSIALQIAGVFQTGKFLHVIRGDLTLYALVSTMMSCLFSAACATLLQCIDFASKRRKQRVFLWLTLLSLAVANYVMVLPLLWSREIFSLRGPGTAWEIFCAPPAPFKWVHMGSAAGIILTIIAAWTFTPDKWKAVCCEQLTEPVRMCIPEKWRPEHLPLPGMVLRYLFVLFSLLLMWILLGLMATWRWDVSDVALGYNNKDGEWTFGQVLAVATWAPTVRELINVLFSGPKHGMNGRMSEKYHVVEFELDSDGSELEKKPTESKGLRKVWHKFRELYEYNPAFVLV